MPVARRFRFCWLAWFAGNIVSWERSTWFLVLRVIGSSIGWMVAWVRPASRAAWITG